MKRSIFAAVATALVILPLGVNAAQTNLEPNSIQEPSLITQLAQNQMKQGKRMGRGDRMEKFLQQLELTPEQSQQIETIQEQSRTENETLWQEMQTNHEQMQSLLSSDASPEQLRQQHQQVQALRQQLGDNRFETMLEVREILTPEQRTQMAELMEQHRGQRGGYNFNN